MVQDNDQPILNKAAEGSLVVCYRAALTLLVPDDLTEGTGTDLSAADLRCGPTS